MGKQVRAARRLAGGQVGLGRAVPAVRPQDLARIHEARRDAAVQEGGGHDARREVLAVGQHRVARAGSRLPQHAQRAQQLPQLLEAGVHGEGEVVARPGSLHRALEGPAVAPLQVGQHGLQRLALAPRAPCPPPAPEDR